MRELHNYTFAGKLPFTLARAVLAVPIGRLPTECFLEDDGWEGVGPGG